MTNTKAKLDARSVELTEKLSKELAGVVGLSLADAKSISEKVKGINQLYLLSSLRFLRYTQSITEPTFTFRFLGTVFILESLASPKDMHNKRDKVKKYVKGNLTDEEKISLLTSFEFSEPYPYLTKAGEIRHLMFGEFSKDKDFLARNLINSPEEVDFCSGGSLPLCHCKDWLMENKQRLNKYMDKFIDILYEIRNSIVHEASHVSFMPLYDQEEMREYTSYEESLVDVYSLIYKTEDSEKVVYYKNYFRIYESYMNPEDFFTIIKNCIKSDLKKLL
jgi:hypothetical protein